MLLNDKAKQELDDSINNSLQKNQQEREETSAKRKRLENKLYSLKLDKALTNIKVYQEMFGKTKNQGPHLMEAAKIALTCA